MIYVTEKCPKCGNYLRYFEPKTNYISFGKPFKICPYCGAAIKEEKLKEAIQFNEGDVLSYYFLRIFFSLPLVFLVSFSPYIVDNMFDLNIAFIQKYMPIIFVVIFILTVIVLFKITRKSFKRGLMESKIRLKNNNYLNQLLHYGFITTTQYQNFLKNGKVDIENYDKPHKKNNNEQIIQFCRNCGKKLNEETEYCHQCGTKIKR